MDGPKDISRMSNIESNDSQNGGSEDYIKILMESFHTLVPLYKDSLRVVKDYYIDGRNTRFCQCEVGEDF